MRKETKEASEDTKQMLTTVEDIMKDLTTQIEKLEGKLKEMEDRV